MRLPQYSGIPPHHYVVYHTWLTCGSVCLYAALSSPWGFSVLHLAHCTVPTTLTADVYVVCHTKHHPFTPKGTPHTSPQIGKQAKPFTLHMYISWMGYTESINLPNESTHQMPLHQNCMLFEPNVFWEDNQVDCVAALGGKSPTWRMMRGASRGSISSGLLRASFFGSSQLPDLWLCSVIPVASSLTCLGTQRVPPHPLPCTALAY